MEVAEQLEDEAFLPPHLGRYAVRRIQVVVQRLLDIHNHYWSTPLSA